LEQDVADLVDSLEKLEIDAVDAGHLAQPVAGGVPDKGGMGCEIRRWRRGSRQAFQSRGNSFQPLENPLFRLACHVATGSVALSGREYSVGGEGTSTRRRVAKGGAAAIFRRQSRHGSVELVG